MQNEIVNYRYSDTNFISYLMTLGVPYTRIEINRDRNKQLKAYVYFQEEKNKLIDLYEQFQNESVTINLFQFCNNRKKISKIIKAELLKFQISALDRAAQ
jgi:hypothetical protein